MNKRVLLGMSGGVDSSVSAILLKEQGGSLTLHIKSYCIINWDNVIFFDFFLFFSCVLLRVVLIYMHKHSKENFL